MAWMVVIFVSSFQHATIISPMMSIGPKEPEADVPWYYGAVLAQQLALGCLVFTLVWAGAELSTNLFPEWQTQGLVLSLACVATACRLQDFLHRYFFTRDRGTTAFMNDAARHLTQLIVLFWLLQTTAMDIARTLWVMSSAAGAATIYGAFLTERIGWTLETFLATTSRHWKFSKWLIASTLLQWTSANLPSFAMVNHINSEPGNPSNEFPSTGFGIRPTARACGWKYAGISDGARALARS